MIRIRFKPLIVLIILPLILLTMPLSNQSSIKMAAAQFMKGPIKITNVIRPKAKQPMRQKGDIPALSVSANELLLENNRLRSLLGFKRHLPYKSIACQVTARDPTNWTAAIILNKGSNSGLKVDLPIIDVNGLAGRIIEVGPSLSKAILISDFNSRVVALTERARQIGVIYGINRNVCKMRYLPLYADVKIHDKVITSGLGGIYPKGLTVGNVIGVAKEADGLSLCAFVKISSQLDKLEEVLAIQQ